MHERTLSPAARGGPARLRAPGPAGFAIVTAVLILAGVATAPAILFAEPPGAGAPARSPAEIAREACALDDIGAYGQAAELLRALRRQAGPDADLDLALALDLARAGEPDSAAALLWNATLSAALVDSLPVARRQAYGWGRDPLWLNGAFDGWHWYVARARAEVAAARGRWTEALEAARQCVAARRLAGKEWLVLAVCAGRAGAAGEAATAARKAVTLDPTLPEAHYLHGLHQWRAGRRASAHESFRTALGLDSTYRAAALATVRCRLRLAPDTLPSRFLTGVREIGLLTSPARPKCEEFVEMETPAVFLRGAQAVIPDSLKTGWTRIQVSPRALVDGRGHIVLHEFPWTAGSRVPEAMIGLMLSSLPHWRYRPGLRLGEPYPTWVPVDLDYSP